MLVVAGITAATVIVKLNPVSEKFQQFYMALKDSLNKWHPRGYEAYVDASKFVMKSIETKIPVENTLGYWVLFNLKGNKTLNDEEHKAAGIIGAFLFGWSENWWEDMDKFKS